MQSIQLTQKHKDKLIEMCKALFPEYNNIYFRIDSKSSCIYPKEISIDNNILRIGSFGKLDLSIHWFEFCMMELAPKIMPPFIDCEEFYSGLLGLDEVDSYQKHPVDYLYEQFKELK